MADINLGVGGANSAVAGGYDIENSLKFESDNTESLSRSVSSASNKRTWTYSTWVKKTEIVGYGIGGTLFGAYASSSDRARIEQFSDQLGLHGKISNSTQVNVRTNRILRDTSAWYHCMVVLDTTQATSTDRVKIYINGVQETSMDVATYPSQNLEFEINNSSNHFVGQKGDNTDYFNGYMAETHFIDGTAKSPTDFGEYDEDSGIWKPKAYTGSYGTNGFYLDFESSGSLGADGSGNGNNFTLNNITAADQATDTPTNNFCTLNPNVNFKYTTNGITEGGTTFGDDTGGGVGGAFGTMAVTSGKWYWEVKLVQQFQHYIGVSAIDDGDNVLSTSDPHQVNSTFNFNISAARIEYFNSGSFTTGSLDAFSDFHTAGDIIGIALNMDDNQISIYGNGTLQSGVANTSLFDAANKMVVPFHGTINDEVQYNFGGYSAWTPASPATDDNGYGTFEYAPPSGYYALCTKNLAEYG